MTTRTFKQMGIAYGADPANITAKIDNVVVYQGPVTTLNEPFPELSNLEIQITNELFSWTNDVAYTGNAVIDISVDGTATLLVAGNSANYSPVPPPDGIGNAISSGPNVYVGLGWQQFGNTFVDGQFVEPNTIDHDPLGGQWWFKVNSSFVENMTIYPGLE